MTPERFADLYRAERAELARSIARIVGPDQAEDLVHDAFLAYLATDPDAGKPGAWLSKVARNRALNQVRRPRALPLTPGIEAGDEPNLGREAEREAMRALVAETLAGLEERSRTALRLRFFEGRSYEEIAVALGVRVPQAHVVVHRATRRFGRELVGRIAAAHGAQGCAEAISSVAGANGHACERCRSVSDEIAALRSLPAFVPLLPLGRVRRALEGLWRRSARGAEPAGQVAQALAAGVVAVAGIAGGAGPARVPSLPRGPVVAVAPVRAPAPTAQDAAPKASVARTSTLPATSVADVPERNSVANAGPVRVSGDDTHTQVDAGGEGGVVVCEPLEPCPPGGAR